MKKLSLLVAALISVGSVFAGATMDAAALRAKALKDIKPIPQKVPGSEKDTDLQIQLGKKLYFEKRLSADDTVSCNTCHAVDGKSNGVDGKPVSDGVGGKKGNRNSPTVLNSAFLGVQFWDGRAPNLKEQAKGPILNPVEMAMPDELTTIKKLAADKDYPAEFKAAFPDDEVPLSFENIAGAIAAFERTLITRDRFDDFLEGDNDALTAIEKEGLELFLKAGCVSCHNGPLLGGKGFYKIGLHKPYPNKDDLGRFDFSKKNSDKFKFRVPTLRNVELTAPYYHDGKMESLEDAVDGMESMQIRRDLSMEEKAAIAHFLKSLTGKVRE